MYSSKLSVGLHLLCLVARSDRPVTSSNLAESIGTNPVLVRRLMSQLKKAGVLQTQPHLGAVGLGKPPEQISMLEVFRAVEPNQTLFDIHTGTNPNCPVGAHIGKILQQTYQAAQKQMEAQLAQVSLTDILLRLPPDTSRFLNTEKPQLNQKRSKMKMSQKKIGVLVGSLRRGSYNRSIAKAAVSLAPEELQFHFLELGDLQMYNQDLDDDGNPPAAWTRFRKELADMDGFLFVTPEYNRSMPAVLKNALDVGSRPYGQNFWSGKPGGIISVSPGAMGGFGANHHLRQPMVFLNVLIMQQPEEYIGHVNSLLDDKGELTDESTRKYLKTYMQAFAKWVHTIADADE